MICLFGLFKIVGNEILRRILNIELHPDSRRTIMVKRIVS